MRTELLFPSESCSLTFGSLSRALSYTDDGDATALCRWTVDLAALPRFHYIAQAGGGYVE